MVNHKLLHSSNAKWPFLKDFPKKIVLYNILPIFTFLPVFSYLKQRVNFIFALKFISWVIYVTIKQNVLYKINITLLI